MIKTLNILLLVIFLNSCFAGMPVMQSSVPAENNTKKRNISAGVGKIAPIPVDSGESKYFVVAFGSMQERVDDVFSYEFFPLGAKLTEDLFKGSFLYISIFQSLYLLGFNYGIIIATVNQKINFYMSSRMDYLILFNIIPAEGYYGEGKYSTNTSSIGINFKEKDFTVFMEFVAFFPIKTYSKRGYIDKEGDSIYTIDTLYTERFYSFQLGVSF